jgi:hypothetical protein
VEVEVDTLLLVVVLPLSLVALMMVVQEQVM